MPFAQHDHVVQTLSTYRADNTFAIRVLPRRAWCDRDFFDVHAFHAILEIVAVDAVTITNEKTWRLLIRESVDDLLGSPLGVGIRGNVEVNHLPPVVTDHDEDVQDTKGHGRNGEEVARRRYQQRDWPGTFSMSATAVSGYGPCTWPPLLRRHRNPARAAPRGFEARPRSSSPGTCGESGHGFPDRWVDVQVFRPSISTANTA